MYGACDVPDLCSCLPYPIPRHGHCCHCGCCVVDQVDHDGGVTVTK